MSRSDLFGMSIGILCVLSCEMNSMTMSLKIDITAIVSVNAECVSQCEAIPIPGMYSLIVNWSNCVFASILSHKVLHKAGNSLVVVVATFSVEYWKAYP